MHSIIWLHWVCSSNSICFLFFNLLVSSFCCLVSNFYPSWLILDFYLSHFIVLMLYHFILLFYFITLSWLFLLSTLKYSCFLFNVTQHLKLANRNKYWLKGCIWEVGPGPTQGMLKDTFFLLQVLQHLFQISTNSS